MSKFEKPATVHMADGTQIHAVHHAVRKDGWLWVSLGDRSLKIPPQRVDHVERVYPPDKKPRKSGVEVRQGP